MSYYLCHITEQSTPPRFNDGFSIKFKLLDLRCSKGHSNTLAAQNLKTASLKFNISELKQFSDVLSDHTGWCNCQGPQFGYLN